MKKQFILIAILAVFVGVSNQSKAQENFFVMGFEGGLPIGDWAKDAYSFELGISASYEVGITENIGVNAEVGWDFLLTDPNNDYLSGGRLIPIQLGANYYFDEARYGFYGGVQTGVHIMKVEFSDNYFNDGGSTSNTYFSFAPQVGYFLNGSMSVALRYQMIFVSEDEDTGSDGDTASILALRLNYLF